jgi:hypothetical protein
MWQPAEAHSPSTAQAQPMSSHAWSSLQHEPSSATPPSCSASRGVLILPGLGNNSADYDDLAAKLRAMGAAVEVASVSRPDWSRNAAALTDGNWWRGTLKPRPAVDWYMEKTDAAMQSLKRAVDGAPITVLTHSVRVWTSVGWGSWRGAVRGSEGLGCVSRVFRAAL